MHIRLLFIVTLGIIGSSFSGTAQTTERLVEKVNGFIGLQVGLPARYMQPAIRNNMGNTGFGIGGMVLSNPFSWGRNKRNSALRIGAELGYTYYGRFITKVDIRGYRGDYKTSYGILNLNGVLQLRPFAEAPLRPFFEIIAGGSFYISQIRENLDAIETALGIPAFELEAYSSASFNKGAAVGFSFGKRRDGRGCLTVRGSYNIGSDIKYIVRNSLQYNSANGYMEYAVGKAPVRYFLVQAGIGF
ncbi:MAG: hypothetical protein ABW007_16455 [Chitinophagaceae bacterium]